MLQASFSLGCRGVLAGVLLLILSGCYGDDDDSPVPIVQGLVSFDSVPTAVEGTDARLAYERTVRKPARFVVVEAIDPASNAVIGSAVTDANGRYSLPLPASTELLIRVKAQMPVTPGNPLAVNVVDNTNSNAQWAIDGPRFSSGNGDQITQDLNAGSGWTGSGYDNSVRGAGPFAILDTLFQAVQKVTSVDATAAFPPLIVYWSPNNVAGGAGETEAELAAGQIGTSDFRGPEPDKGLGFRLYLLGKADNDTDEYDAHVITHEFGHYLQSAFSRDDNIGGRHDPGDVLDIRTAFSEGWGNGWSSIALNDPVYTDTLDVGQSKGSVFDVSVGSPSSPGWFSEGSVQKFFWDFSREPSIGFGNIWNALKNGLKQTPALTSIHNFSFALTGQAPNATSAIAAILQTQSVLLATDPYASNELFFGSPEVLDLRPLYLLHPGAGQVLNAVCVNNALAPVEGMARQINRAGEFRFIRLAALPEGTRTVTVIKQSTTNATATPVFNIYGRTGQIAESKDDGVDGQTLVFSADGGDYVLALSDAQLTGVAAARSCFSVRLD